ncbi:beta-1,4-galactosyltransferase 6-like [Antedon mediterranea]|uniref:beta-1,4-galactosyltransferase 6-like n=1 Tax=Antedon mediterranea TaxID=105859 RepID=UPI003AF6A3C2
MTNIFLNKPILVWRSMYTCAMNINWPKISLRNILTDLKLRYVLRTLWILVCLGVITTIMLWNEVMLKSESVDRTGMGIPLTVPRDKSVFRHVRSWMKKPRHSSDQAGIVCPSEFELTGLRGNLSADLNATTLTFTEQEIFREQTEEVLQVTHDMNLRLNVNLFNRRHKRDYSPLTIEDILLPSILYVKDYLYIPGGHWKPTDCLPRWKVAIIIPFRDRYSHLPIFLKHIIPMLHRQKLEFGIFVIEQDNMLLFNRAMLLNVGFLESLNFTKWDCFIYHDVDHVPYNDGNYYGCIGMPRHFITGADRWGYKLQYNSFFGAVTGMTRGQIFEMNGFPNVYWGWGGEDDDIWQRVKSIGYTKTRPRSYIGWYDVIKQDHKSAPHNKERVASLKYWKKRHLIDGLNNIVYDEPIITLYSLYTNIAVNIQKLNIDIEYEDYPTD